MSRKPTYEELEYNLLELKKAERDRKKMEDLLRDEITWRRILVEQSRDGIVVLDQNGKVYEANKRYADMLGYSMEEVHQLHVWDWDAQFSKEQLIEMIRNVDDSGAHFETQHRRKDGTIIDLELSNNGAVYRGQKLIFCICRDITERKQAEEALRNAEKRFLHVTENIGEWIWEIDTEGIYQYCSPAVVRILGYTPDELVGKKYFYDFFAPDVREATMEEALAQFRRKGPFRGFVNRNLHRYGGIVILETSGTPTLDEKGNLLGYRGANMDITERKRSEEALRESEERYRQIAENMADVVWICDLNFKIIYISPSVEKMAGEPVDIHMKRTVEERFPPDSLRRIYAIVSEEFEREKCPHRDKDRARLIEVQYYRADGTTLWIAMNVSFVRDKEGNAVGFQGISRDITDRKETEEALRESEDRYRAFMDASSDMVYVKDDQLRHVIANNTLLTFFGREEADVIGKTDFELMPEPAARNCLASDQEAIRAKSPVVTEEPVGDRIYETNKFPVVLKGNRIGVGGIIRDITERRRVEEELGKYRDQLEDLVKERTAELAKANERLTLEMEERREVEQALQESQQMLQLVLDTIPVRVFWKNPDSSYLGCNRPFALDAGLQSPEQIIGRNDFEMGWAEQADLYTADDRLVMESGIPKLGYEEPQTTPEGGRLWLRTNKIPLFGANGQITGMLGTYEDITVHKQAEEVLRKAHDELERRVQERTLALEKANEELRQIPSKLIAAQEEERRRLASELHDSIGQTLAAVKFWVEMALKLKAEGSGTDALNHLERFIPTLQRSIEETRNIYMGLRPPMLDSMGLLATLEWLRRESMKLFPQRHIELETGIAEDEIPEILKVNIFRIVQEALNNVARHSNAEWVDISLSKNWDRIELAVSDDGAGMELDMIIRTSTARSLGLTSMRERAELTGGSFSIESTPGKGTIIRACWPNDAKDIDSEKVVPLKSPRH
ncbi:MAG: PAS domain S-box protein [Syntrophobacter sp.]